MSASNPPGAPSERSDQELVSAAVAGEADAIDALIRRHQRFIYNLALRLVLNPKDAEDLTQEAFIRIITRLDRFEGRSRFTTWAYRIVVRAFLDGRRRSMERAITTFAAYGAELDDLPSRPLELSAEWEPERRLIVEEAKVGCMLGMLLCLDRDQRVAYVLGEIFGLQSSIAGEILGVQAAAFRKRLQRARRDLSSFMNDQCGLINPDNPCRCEKKTAAFIENGWVNPSNMKFVGSRVTRLKREAPSRSEALCRVEAEASDLYRSHPMLEGPDMAARTRRLLSDPNIQTALDLN